MADPRVVVAVQVNAVITGVAFYLLWFAPPAPPFWGAALGWWALLVAVAAWLWARQSRRHDSGALRGGVGERLLRGLAVVAGAGAPRPVRRAGGGAAK
jgi:hypothetical protein